MSKAMHISPETLYHHWRKGDASSGQALAQRFTDWYYAIAANRLGEDAGDVPFRAACKKFSKGVASVDDARRLLGWAHGIAVQQIHATTPTGRVADGDLANNFSRKASPKQLLVQARDALPHEMHLLENAYLGRPVPDPLAVLTARYEVKGWLADQLDLPFKVLTDTPDPDRIPLVFYEAGHLASDSEDTSFELYMLADADVCQDVAEFAHFAIALRGGLPGQIPEAGRPRQDVGPRTLPEPLAPTFAARTVEPTPTPTPARPSTPPSTAGLKAVVRHAPPPDLGPATATPATPTPAQRPSLVIGVVVIVVLVAALWWMTSGA